MCASICLRFLSQKCLGCAQLRMRELHNGPGQKKKHSKNSHLIIHFPTSWGMSKWASKQTSERSGAREHSVRKRVSCASERRNGRTSGLALTSGFLVILNHSELVNPKRGKRNGFRVPSGNCLDNFLRRPIQAIQSDVGRGFAVVRCEMERRGLRVNLVWNWKRGYCGNSGNDGERQKRWRWKNVYGKTVWLLKQLEQSFCVSFFLSVYLSVCLSVSF